MKRDSLDRVYGPTPELFTDQIDDTLHALQEDAPMNAKRFTLRTALVAALILLLLCGIAYAIVATQGQEWYYNNRFTAYQEHEPEKQQAILDNLQTEVPQEESADAQGLVAVTVQDYAWSNEQKLFTLSIAARTTHETGYELYALWDMDADGMYGDTPDPENPDARTEHWIMTPKGFGLPENVMENPSDQLILFDPRGGSIWIGNSSVEMPGWSIDYFTGEDGASVWVMECDLSLLDEEAIRSLAGATQEDIDHLLAYAKKANAAIAENTDADGYLSLRVEYLVYPFSQGELGKPAQGALTFKVKTN
jgi:hypothetical protein